MDGQRRHVTYFRWKTNLTIVHRVITCAPGHISLLVSVRIWTRFKCLSPLLRMLHVLLFLSHSSWCSKIIDTGLSWHRWGSTRRLDSGWFMPSTLSSTLTFSFLCILSLLIFSLELKFQPIFCIYVFLLFSCPLGSLLCHLLLQDLLLYFHLVQSICHLFTRFQISHFLTLELLMTEVVIDLRHCDRRDLVLTKGFFRGA